MENADVGAKGANSQLLEIEALNEAMAKQRAEITRLRDVLNLTGTGKILSGFDSGWCCHYKTQVPSPAFIEKHLAEGSQHHA